MNLGAWIAEEDGGDNINVVLDPALDNTEAPVQRGRGCHHTISLARLIGKLPLSGAMARAEPWHRFCQEDSDPHGGQWESQWDISVYLVH